MQQRDLGRESNLGFAAARTKPLHIGCWSTNRAKQRPLMQLLDTLLMIVSCKYVGFFYNLITARATTNPSLAWQMFGAKQSYPGAPIITIIVLIQTHVTLKCWKGSIIFKWNKPELQAIHFSVCLKYPSEHCCCDSLAQECSNPNWTDKIQIKINCLWKAISRRWNEDIRSPYFLVSHHVSLKMAAPPSYWTSPVEKKKKRLLLPPRSRCARRLGACQCGA